MKFDEISEYTSFLIVCGCCFTTLLVTLTIQIKKAGLFMTDELEEIRTKVAVAKHRYCPIICLDGVRKNCEKVKIADDPPKI